MSSKKAGLASGAAASRNIDQRIRELDDWRGETLARVRAMILAAHPGITEEWKWNVPVWSHGGIICTGEVYAKAVKLTFAKGASVADPTRLFNSSFTGNARRAIDIREGELPNARAFKALIKAAVARNAAGMKAATPAKAKAAGTRRTVTLLSGGNPQIAKADGDAPVQAYIAAVPGWKRDVARRLDAIITRAAPRARKAVKWNSPMYGIEGRGWFASFHVYARYVKLVFFKGTSLRPAPPGGSGKEGRWIDVHEDDLDERQVAAWVKQAAALPGWGS